MEKIVLSILFLSAFSGCGQIFEDRTLPGTPLVHIAVQSAFSKEELQERGNSVIYTFKTVPNAYLIRKNFVTPVTPVQQSEDVIRARASNQRITYEFTRPTSSSLDATRMHLTSFNDAGFDIAYSAIKSAQVSLKPIKVAVIDSGINPVTYAIKNQLKENINLTLDPNNQNWLPHATAIASVFSGREEQHQIKDTFASNAELISVKIAFNNDKNNILNQDLGSMQLAVALDEAISKGAKIVNLSFVYRGDVPENVRSMESWIMSEAKKKGVIFVAAAGNQDENLDKNGLLPASYQLENLVVVGSHTGSLNKTPSSNYGNKVDLTALASSLRLTNLKGEVENFAGTSFAAPIVAAALSLYMGAADHEISVNETLHDLFETTDVGYASPVKTDSPVISKYGRLNTGAFVQKAIRK